MIVRNSNLDYISHDTRSAAIENGKFKFKAHISTFDYTVNKLRIINRETVYELATSPESSDLEVIFKTAINPSRNAFGYAPLLAVKPFFQGYSESDKWTSTGHAVSDRIHSHPQFELLIND